MALSDSNREKKLQGSAVIIPAPVSSSFCVPHESQFKIVDGGGTGGSAYQVLDLSGNAMFTFNPYSSGQVGRDDHGRAIVSLKQKSNSWVFTWYAYRGEKSQAKEDLLFTMKMASRIFWISYNIWLPGNRRLKIPDFTLSVNFCRSHIKIRHRGMIIAEARIKADHTIVIVTAGVDRVFIAAILLIQDIIDSEIESI